MKWIVALMLLGLVACANPDAWKNEKTVMEYPPGKFQLLSRNEYEALRAKDAKDQAARRAQESEEARVRQEQLAKQEAVAQQATRDRIAADEARGYRAALFADFYLDYKTKPIGSKWEVTGFYQVFGQLETLADQPSDSPLDNVPRVAVLTKLAPREVRAKLLGIPCRTGFCKVTFLGHTTPCTISWLGSPIRNDVCLTVDEMW